jgi:hypothetical protein
LYVQWRFFFFFNFQNKIIINNLAHCAVYELVTINENIYGNEMNSYQFHIFNTPPQAEAEISRMPSLHKAK